MRPPATAHPSPTAPAAAAAACSTSTSRTSAASGSTATATATPHRRPSGPYDTWAYCAFDNDYAEFPAHTPQENLEVTAAHELFHAVQFAYDYDEDAWFMEATATWAEDEVYNDVNDNLQYLAQSPLSQPRQSMDHFAGLRQYGDWIFFRYLTERFPHASGGLPVLVRDLWERADGAAGGPDDYSMQAVEHELKARGTSVRKVFAAFADANRHPGAQLPRRRRQQLPRRAPRCGPGSSSRSTATPDGSAARSTTWPAPRSRSCPSSSMRHGWRLKIALDLPRTLARLGGGRHRLPPVRAAEQPRWCRSTPTATRRCGRRSAQLGATGRGHDGERRPPLPLLAGHRASPARASPATTTGPSGSGCTPSRSGS